MPQAKTAAVEALNLRMHALWKLNGIVKKQSCSRLKLKKLTIMHLMMPCRICPAMTCHP